MRLRLVAALGVLLLSLGCDHPTPTESPLAGSVVNLYANFENAEASPTVLRYQCFLDGVAISPEVTFSTPQASIAAAGTIDALGPGRHDFSVRILDQVGSPTTYRLTNVGWTRVVTDNGVQTTPASSGGTANSLHTIRTGESISWVFTER
ncbi:MAG: hypothetical protein IPP07_00410 [Holophagales bacterium]|jgi:hypothetical protein|nr:hypothetical protein [Holophagales bacterium]MBK9963426.1 hypothetical protein [Holophagales bacterium]